MASEFFERRGARRVRGYPPQPVWNEMNELTDEDEPRPTRVLHYELPPDDWRAIDVRQTTDEFAEAPRRFIDGCLRSETVAWVEDDSHCPTPIILAQIGGVAVEALDHGASLRRDFEVVERVVSMVTDGFPWREIEEFAGELAAQGLRFLPANPPRINPNSNERAPSYDFEQMRSSTEHRSTYEMEVLEELAVSQRPDLPTVVDGRLETKLKRQDLQNRPIVGVIKTHRENYLHPHGNRVLLNLQPSQRTPAFRIQSGSFDVISWYVKLTGERGEAPNYGIIRVEAAAAYLDQRADKFDWMNRLSHWLMRVRCRRPGYGRAAISLEPIVWAEDSLKSLFAPPTLLTQSFYRWTGL